MMIVLNTSISEIGRLFDIEEMGDELIIHDHDCDFWVTTAGWVNVPDRDWGDF